jgi:hypothetical protein
MSELTKTGCNETNSIVHTFANYTTASGSMADVRANNNDTNIQPPQDGVPGNSGCFESKIDVSNCGTQSASISQLRNHIHQNRSIDFKMTTSHSQHQNNVENVEQLIPQSLDVLTGEKTNESLLASSEPRMRDSTAKPVEDKGSETNKTTGIMASGTVDSSKAVTSVELHDPFAKNPILDRSQSSSLFPNPTSNNCTENRNSKMDSSYQERNSSVSDPRNDQYRNQNTQKVLPKPHISDGANAPTGKIVYMNVPHYSPPLGPVAAPYPAAYMHAHHQAAAAAAAASVAAAQNHINRIQNGPNHSVIRSRNSPHSNSQVMNRMHQEPTLNSINAGAATQQSNSIASGNSFANRREPAAPVPVGQQNHAMAASAAEHHLHWRTNNYQNAKVNNGKNERKNSEVIEISDEEQRENLIKHYTAAIARQVGGSDAAAIHNKQDSSAMYSQNLGRSSWQNQGLNDRKRSLPEPTDQEAHKRDVMRRQSAPNPDKHSTTSYFDKMSFGNAANTGGPLQINHSGNYNNSNSSIREVNVNDAMNTALDAAISSESSRNAKKIGATGRRVDTPMTYLVRQLLGQVEVVGDEPAVVLAPHLVKDASQKIRLVINKLIEMIVIKSKKDTQNQIREAEARSEALEEEKYNRDREKAADMAAQVHQQKNMQTLKVFAEEKCQRVIEQDKIIEKLRKRLEKRELELENSKTNQNLASNSNTTLRQLVTQLDEGMSTILRQKNEIEMLKAVIEKDMKTIHEKQNMKSFLEKSFGLVACDVTTDIPRNASEATETIQNQEIIFLKKEVEDLQTALRVERRQSETRLKAYMRAAVHALKIQSGEQKE